MGKFLNAASYSHTHTPQCGLTAQCFQFAEYTPSLNLNLDFILESTGGVDQC